LNVEQRWNDIDRGKLKDSRKNVSQLHFVNNLTWTALGASPGLRGEKQVANRLSYGTAV
jgi:hypothetical protein